MTRREKIKALVARLQGLANDACYWDLRRTYGDYSREVLRHLESCAQYHSVSAGGQGGREKG